MQDVIRISLTVNQKKECNCTILDSSGLPGTFVLNCETRIVNPHDLIEVELRDNDTFAYYRRDAKNYHTLGMVMFEVIKGHLSMLSSNIDVVPTLIEV